MAIMSSDPRSAEVLVARVAVLERMLDASRAETEAANARADQLAGMVEDLLKVVTELEARNNKDSRNSSKPPSKDGLGKRPKPGGKHPGGGRRPGGQPGHEGHRLECREPDEVVLVGPDECRGCGDALHGLDLKTLAGSGTPVVSTAQVLDVPPVKLRCTEYRMLKVTCPGCRTATAAPAPAGVFGPVCYGVNVKAATVLLAVRGHMSVARAAQMMRALLDAEVSTGFTSSLIRRLADELAPFMADLKERLRNAKVLHLDETPASVSGDEMRQFEAEALLRGERLDPGRRQPGPEWMYVHVARSGPLIWLGAHKRRSHEATDSFDILTGYEGVLVTDRLALYDKYAIKAAGRQICCAHILRDLTGVIEGEPGRDHAWAEAAQDALRDFHAAVEIAKGAGHGRLDAAVSAELHQRWRHAYLVGLAQNTGRRTSQNKRHPAWIAAEMLKKRTGEILLFTTDFEVEWTNNPAERALRMVKLQMAVGGCWRRVESAQWYCTVRSYLDTARAHGEDLLDALRDAFTGNAWMPPAAT